jgi:sarcosine oxidase subunit alpha
MCDVSSLGKIDIQGADAAEFLDRVYVNGFKSLPVGKARYGVMLRQDGIVLDDGTTSRIDEHCYFMTTTTGNAGKVMTNLEFLLQSAWPDLRVHVTTVTSQWAGIAVAGPTSRDLLRRVCTDVDFENGEFPFMGVRHGHVGEIPVRILRISFSGELAYEVYTPAGYGEAIWQTLYEAGRAFDIALYGTEALGTLRIEKGHVAGPELDGRTTLGDLGLARMASQKKAFLGSALMKREGLVDSNRPHLVGLELSNGAGRLRSGAILCKPAKKEVVAVFEGFPVVRETPERQPLGFISSVSWSPELGKDIAIGFVSGGMRREGEVIDALFPLYGESALVRVISPHFVDPEGEHLNA